MANPTRLDDAAVFRAVTALYAVGFVLHTADHFRRGVAAVTLTCSAGASSWATAWWWAAVRDVGLRS